MSGRYATNTEVSVDKSKTDIERLLKKYGAKAFGYAWKDEEGLYTIQFEIADRRVRFLLPMPHLSEFTKTPTGKFRSEDSMQLAWEQAQRQRWRALVLVIKAKLEAVESGILSFEEEFLSHIILPNGQTVGEWTAPQLEGIYASKQMPRFLPGLPPGGGRPGELPEGRG